MSPSIRLSHILVCGVVVLPLIGCHQRSGTAAGYAPGKLPQSPAAGAIGAADVALTTRGTDAARAGRESSDIRTSRIEDLFAARFPGLHVERTGTGDLVMRLRGVEPLLLIDGLEADPIALVAVPPSTVRRIEVLRSVSETAIYGSRGVNGVVRVTTHGG